MRPWWTVSISYSTFPGKFVWFFLNDRGANQGMYCQRTLGLDGVNDDLIDWQEVVRRANAK